MSKCGEAEGVIKFDLTLEEGAAPAKHSLEQLLGWRQILFRLGLTGQTPLRYGGLAYGNVSVRLDSGGFILSGTQTGGKARLDADDFCTVVDYDLSRNRLRARGPVPPSSEALTHAAVYHADPRCRSVLHVHCPEIWRRHASLGLPGIPAGIAYGTPAMAMEVGKRVRRGRAGALAMLGHEDGIISYGCSAQSAALNLLRTLARCADLLPDHGA